LNSRLQHIKQLSLSCRQCQLRSGCRGVVFGEGNPQADLMLVGEGPGQTEDELGRPFVGVAGQLLDKIIQSVGFVREEVYITNVIKCRPPYNRTPKKEEMDVCSTWLMQEIRQIKPKIIVCLGSVASKQLIDPDFRIMRQRGIWLDFEGIKVIATFHPAALLRDPSKKRPVWEDFKQIRVVFDRLVAGSD
jgi:uracil-DNA glycosylase family 4